MTRTYENYNTWKWKRKFGGLAENGGHGAYKTLDTPAYNAFRVFINKLTESPMVNSRRRFPKKKGKTKKLKMKQDVRRSYYSEDAEADALSRVNDKLDFETDQTPFSTFKDHVRGFVRELLLQEKLQKS
jgi:hypothetical protein